MRIRDVASATSLRSIDTDSTAPLSGQAAFEDIRASTTMHTTIGLCGALLAFWMTRRDASLSRSRMSSRNTELHIDEYLRERLMPVAGVIPHLPGIDMYGDSTPAEAVGGDLFEYINFPQRYDLDARIRKALKSSAESPRPDDYLEWLRSRPEYTQELAAAHKELCRLEKMRVAENLRNLYHTA